MGLDGRPAAVAEAEHDADCAPRRGGGRRPRRAPVYDVRSAWLGFAAGALYLIYHATKSHRNAPSSPRSWRLERWRSVPSWQVLVLIGLDLPFLAFSRAQDVSGGIAIRYDLASEAMEAFAENPLIGVGRANLIPFTGYVTAYSFYLTRLAEDGLLGLAIILVWLGAIWRRGAPLVAPTVEPGLRWAATGLRSAFLGCRVEYSCTTTSCPPR